MDVNKINKSTIKIFEAKKSQWYNASQSPSTASQKNHDALGDPQVPVEPLAIEQHTKHHLLMIHFR